MHCSNDMSFPFINLRDCTICIMLELFVLVVTTSKIWKSLTNLFILFNSFRINKIAIAGVK